MDYKLAMAAVSAVANRLSWFSIADDRRAAPQGRRAARSRATAGSNRGEDKGADAPAENKNG